MTGAMIRVFRVPLGGWVAVALGVSYLLTPEWLKPYVLWVVMPYAILTIGMKQFPVIRDWAMYGDFSYGMYLYAFPLQQILSSLSGGRITATAMAILSFIGAVALGFLSWHIVEKSALKLKMRSSRQN